MGQASLGGLPFRIDPDSVQWQFRMKVAKRRTVGGMVVQVYGTELGDMQVSGAFGFGDRARGDTAGWEDQERFRAQVERWVDESVSTSGARPLRFLYPPRGWDFQVLVKAYGSRGGGVAVVHDPATYNPTYTLILFVVQDSAQRVVSGIRDLYVQRLMDGVGWRQTEYNGPLTQAEVDQVLAPYEGDVKSYLAEQFDQAAGFHRSNVPEGQAQPATGPGGSVDDWITQAGEALGRSFTTSERAGLKIIASHESSNNPRAENDTDSNAREGHPTKGLMQMRDDTFAEHALPGHTDILDPVDNIISAVRYIEARYGSIDNVPGVVAVRAGQAYRGY